MKAPTAIVLTVLYCVVCLAMSIVFIQIGHGSPVAVIPMVSVTGHKYAQGVWKAQSDRSDVENFWCASDGHYGGHIESEKGGYYNTFVEESNKGSFISSGLAKAHIEETANCK